MRIRELREKRARIINELRQISDAPEGDAGDLSEDQESRFNELKAELQTIEKRIERAEYLDDQERRMSGTPLSGTRGDDFETGCRDYSLVNVIRSSIQGVQVDIGREREVSQEMSRRSGRNFEGIGVPYNLFHRQISQREVERRNVTTSGSGSNLVFTDHRGDLHIDVLRDKTIIAQAGAMTLSGLSGNVDIPKTTDGVTTEWIDEDSESSKSDPTFGKVQMTPKTLAARSEVTRNMVLQSSPEIEMLIRDMMAADFAVALDRAALRGGGGSEPTGIIGTAGINSVDFSAGMSWGGILSMIELCEQANEFGGNAFALGPSLKQALRSTVRVSGTDSRFIMEGANSLADYPAYTTNLTDENGSPYDLSIIFGNWSKLMLGIWGDGFDFLANPYESTAYNKGNIQLRAMMSVDVALRTPASFCVGINIPESFDDN